MEKHVMVESTVDLSDNYENFFHLHFFIIFVVKIK